MTIECRKNNRIEKWHLASTEEPEAYMDIDNEAGGIVARVFLPLENAPLIAATPELLEVCNEVVELVSKIPAFGKSIGKEITKAELGVLLNKATKAMAKAEGR